MFSLDPGGLPLIFVIIFMISGHEVWEVEPRFWPQKSRDREVFKTKWWPWIIQHKASKIFPQHNWIEENRRITEKKNCFGVQGVLKTCTQVLKETARSSLFSSFLKAKHCFCIYSFKINIFNTLLWTLLGSIKISPCLQGIYQV